FSTDGSLLASGSAGEVRVWDLARGQETSVLRKHTGAVTALAFRSDDRQLASAGLDGKVCVVDLAGERVLHTLAITPLNTITSLSYSADGKRLTVVGARVVPGQPSFPGLQVWDVGAEEVVFRLERHNPPLTSVTVSPDGSLAAWGCTDGRVCVRDL